MPVGHQDDDYSEFLDRLDRLDPATRRAVRERLPIRRAHVLISELLRAEDAADRFTPPTSVGNGLGFLGADLGEPTWTISQVHETGSNATLSALYKVGKTTLLMTLLNSLVDGDPFLGM